ncbi:hypothetical protein BON30_02880 [Cystobacter ferrugineus]|uniref:Acyl-CoA dehydrogenase/oxidase C-terminal domain-containing protein n=1 Tax=Cystobacter ferrugineus TaxID=83449 RepID=A0A1L9BIY2_9BACT|nr:hypothetical protein BON30_02880 [Cystobacter ferrugineus]
MELEATASKEPMKQRPSGVDWAQVLSSLKRGQSRGRRRRAQPLPRRWRSRRRSAHPVWTLAGLLKRTFALAILFFGGMGYIEETHIARAWRDIRLITIGGGTSEVMKEILSKMSGFLTASHRGAPGGWGTDALAPMHPRRRGRP